jgi:hypothetical protein
MADKHDKSPNHDPSGKDKPRKPFDMNLELPGETPPEPEVLDEVIEVVDDDVPMVQPASAPEVQSVDDVFEVEEVPEVGAASAPPVAKAPEPPPPPAPESEEVVEVVEVVDEEDDGPKTQIAPPSSGEIPVPPKEVAKTPLRGKPRVPTMIAPDEVEPPLIGSELGGAAADKVEIPEVEEVLEAEAASDARMEAPPPAARRKASDTAEIDFNAQVEEEFMDVEEAPPSSATIAAALAESDMDVAAAQPPEDAPPVKETDRTVAFDSKAEAPRSPQDEEPLDVVVQYEENLESSEVDLGKKPTAKSERPSGVDIIAEALESGVDLQHAAPPPPERATLPDDSDIAYESVLEEARGPAEVDSSAVDLGSGESPSYPESPMSPPRIQRKRPDTDEDIDEVSLSKTQPLPEEDVIDVVGEDALIDPERETQLHDEDDEILVTPKKKTVAAKTTEWEDAAAAEAESAAAREVVDEPAVEEEEVAAKHREEEVEEEKAGAAPRRRTAAYEDEEGGGTATMTRPTKQRSRVLPFMFGGLLAVLFVVVGAAAVWYFSPSLLVDAVKASPNAPNLTSKGPGTGTGSGGGVQPPPGTSAAQKARELIDAGKYEEAIAEVKDAKEGPESAMLALANLKKLEKESKTPLSESDAKVKEYLGQMDAAGAKALADDIRHNFDLNAKLANQGTILSEKDKAIKAAQDKSADLEKLLASFKLPAQADKLKPVMDDLWKAWDVSDKTTQALTNAKLIKADQRLDAPAVMKAVEDAITASKDLGDKLAKVDASLKKVDDALTKAGVKKGEEGVQELVNLQKTVSLDRDRLNTAIDTALKELKEANLTPAEGDKIKQLVEGAKKARATGQSPLGSSLGALVTSLSGLTKEPGMLFKGVFDTTKLQADLVASKAQLALAEPPEQRMDVILAVLGDRGFNDPKDLATFKNYIDWVRSKDSKASPEVRAKALYAAALMERNQEKFDAARKTLEQTLAEAKQLKGNTKIAGLAELALKEMSDPATYYLPRVDAKIGAGQFDGAIAELNAGLKVLPGNPQLVLRRAELELQQAMPKGKIDEAVQKRIRDDAEAARKDAKLAPKSYYLVGQLDEHNGDFGKAEGAYREAVKLAGSGPEADRYRIALARLLQRERPAGTSQLEPAPARKEVVVFVAFNESPVVQAGDDEEVKAAKRLEESVKLAKELMESPDAKTRGEGYILLGTALARQGKKTEGLKSFVKGLELVYPGMATQDLAKIVESHPAFSMPDVAVQSNPVQAERHFGKGLEYFWAKKYGEAEEQFQKAVSFFDQDARYRYFLGLSRYLQNSREKKTLAEYDFEQGVRLEAARKPSTREVNGSLERIQGELRRVLNGYREKMATAG